MKVAIIVFFVISLGFAAQFVIAGPGHGDGGRRRPRNACPRIKTKSQWGGKPAKMVQYQVRPIQFVVVHHTATDACSNFIQCADSIQNIQNYHMNDLSLDDIGYNFLIGNDGLVYEGTGWGVRGAHTYGFNMNGTGIAFIGSYRETLPTEAALTAAKKLLSCGVELGELADDYSLLGASQVIATQSPGLTLYNEIQDWDHWSWKCRKCPQQ